MEYLKRTIGSMKKEMGEQKFHIEKEKGNVFHKVFQLQ